MLPLFARAEEAFDPKAYQQLAAACGQNDLDSCVKFAVWTQEHTNTPADAYAPLKKACDGGNMKGCYALANLYLDPRSGLGANKDKARALYWKACDIGHELSYLISAHLRYKENKQSQPVLPQ